MVVDWMPPPGMHSQPRAVQTKEHGLAPGIAEPELRAAGFTINNRDDHFVDTPDVQRPMWMLVAIRP